jgi:hypothetical protein
MGSALMTLEERADAFARTYPRWSAAWPRVVSEDGRHVLYATWLLGNDYRNKTKYYGAYPPGFVDRVLALFPDVPAARVQGTVLTTLHAFSGSLPAGRYVRMDVNGALDPDVAGSVYEAASLMSGSLFELILADPPYSALDAKQYGTPGLDRRRALAGLAGVAAPGGHLVWLDTCWPMHSKRQWLTVGRIAIVRSTNHRVRMVTIFQRVAA